MHLILCDIEDKIGECILKRRGWVVVTTYFYSRKTVRVWMKR